jgi:hypothetical protein
MHKVLHNLCCQHDLHLHMLYPDVISFSPAPRLFSKPWYYLIGTAEFTRWRTYQRIWRQRFSTRSPIQVIWILFRLCQSSSTKQRGIKGLLSVLVPVFALLQKHWQHCALGSQICGKWKSITLVVYLDVYISWTTKASLCFHLTVPRWLTSP